MTTDTCIRVTLSQQADCFLKCATPAVRNHLIGMIREKCQHTDTQMVVISMTCECDDFIYRAMKSYVYSPGLRCIFHVVRRGQHIHIDRIAWRDTEPYQPLR